MVLKKKLRILSLVNKTNSRYLKNTHKFGIEVLKSVAQSYELDKKVGNNIWAYDISKEMKDVRPVFQKLKMGILC